MLQSGDRHAQADCALLPGLRLMQILTGQISIRNMLIQPWGTLVLFSVPETLSQHLKALTCSYTSCSLSMRTHAPL
jgi:hypothetical protein